jgi:hypothetical protein
MARLSKRPVDSQRRYGSGKGRGQEQRQYRPCPHAPPVASWQVKCDWLWRSAPSRRLSPSALQLQSTTRAARRLHNRLDDRALMVMTLGTSPVGELSFPPLPDSEKEANIVRGHNLRHEQCKCRTSPSTVIENESSMELHRLRKKGLDSVVIASTKLVIQVSSADRLRQHLVTPNRRCHTVDSKWRS